jgi:aminoglycoside phosphotransferase
VDLEACLPDTLRGVGAVITPLLTGLSGAGVYRVDAAGQSYALKISDTNEPIPAWRRKVRIQRLASDAGASPRLVHADETRRGVLTDFVVDRSFVALYWTPGTRETAIVQLAQLIRRVHDIPLAADIETRDAREFLASMYSSLDPRFRVPAFVADAIQRVLTETPPPMERAVVLGHNDVNPGNVVYDGERLLLLDWEAAGVNDPYYDLATAALFLRMDDATCRALLGGYDGTIVSAVPDRFTYLRRLVAALAGAAGLSGAARTGHPGVQASVSLESSDSLAEFYPRLRSGELSLASAEGKLAFGLALLKESALG